MHRIALVALTLAAFTACKKKESKDVTPSSEPSAAKTTEKPTASGPFAAWDMAARRAAFQGAHVGPGDSAGQWQAWNIEGTKITTWDGTAEKTLELDVISPCEAKIVEESAGGSSSTTHHYTLQDGKLVTGLGDAGSRKGPEAIACVSNAIFTVDAKGTCTEWEAPMFDKGEYKQKPATCGFKQDGDKEVFAVTNNGYESKLEVHGDALMSQQLAQTHSEKVADFAAAKTARDAKK
jgi:hypothetical protein